MNNKYFSLVMKGEASSAAASGSVGFTGRPVRWGLKVDTQSMVCVCVCQIDECVSQIFQCREQ